MITQEIIDKLKSNEVPYGILRTKDWFTDEVDQFMKDNIGLFTYYDWHDKWFNIDGNKLAMSEVYRLKQDYVLSNKEVYELLPIISDNYMYFVDLKDGRTEFIHEIDTYTDFLGFYFGTKEQFEEYYNKDITKIDKLLSFVPKRHIKNATGKIQCIIANFIVMKGEEYERFVTYW